jgi:tRNA (guanine10-N2)-methyltransferase
MLLLRAGFERALMNTIHNKSKCGVKYGPYLFFLPHLIHLSLGTMADRANDGGSSTGNRDRYLILVEFAYKHLDFLMAELESVLDMHGIQLGSPQCEIVPLPNQDVGGASSMTTKSRQEQLAASVGSKATTGSKNPGVSRRPFLILSLPADSKFIPKDDSHETVDSDIGSILLGRCTLVRSVMELWGKGTTIHSCAQNTKTWTSQNNVGRSILKAKVGPSQSWKVTVHALGSKYSTKEQEEMRSHFNFLDFAGTVQMKDPTNEFVLIRENELDASGGALYPRYLPGKILLPENDARPPLASYFGRVLGGSRNVKGRGDIDHYSLKKRAYLGPTSMDAELSFVMTNLGQVKKGTIAFDPFVGTGSILISCALRGAFCFGTDIDTRVLKGRSEEENVYSNFRQFNLPRPELVRSDNAIYHRHYRSDTPLYQSIVCDPPYGIRAGARTTGSRRANPKPILDEHRHDHIPQTKPYNVSDVMSDLLDVAARTLVMGGRLVYIIPSFSDFDEETDLPRHECLELVHICYQPLSAELGRRMVVMKKVKPYDPSQRESYLASIWKNGAESAEKCANIRDKILEAAKKKPFYEERLAVRKQKRQETKQAKKIAKRAKLQPKDDD